MILDLSERNFPVRIRFTSNEGEYGSTVAVFQYADGKILTASALVLDPADWKTADVDYPVARPIYSPGWAGKRDEEVADYFGSRMRRALGKNKYMPVSIAVGDDVGKPTAEIRSPKSVTAIGPEDACSDDEAFGTRSK